VIVLLIDSSLGNLACERQAAVASIGPPENAKTDTHQRAKMVLMRATVSARTVTF
jgi:hypothetical protein